MGACEGWGEGEDDLGEEREREPRLPEDLLPPTLAKASVSRTERRKKKKVKRTKLLLIHGLFSLMFLLRSTVFFQ